VIFFFLSERARHSSRATTSSLPCGERWRTGAGVVGKQVTPKERRENGSPRIAGRTPPPPPALPPPRGSPAFPSLPETPRGEGGRRQAVPQCNLLRRKASSVRWGGAGLSRWVSASGRVKEFSPASTLSFFFFSFNALPWPNPLPSGSLPPSPTLAEPSVSKQTSPWGGKHQCEVTPLPGRRGRQRGLTGKSGVGVGGNPQTHL